MLVKPKQRSVFASDRVISSKAILDAIANGITIQDKQGKLIYVNRAAALMAGFTSAFQMLKNPSAWMERFETFNENGKPLAPDKFPGRRIFRGELAPEQLIKYKDKLKNEVKWSIVKARPVFDEKGEVELVVNIIQDLTSQMELKRRKDELIGTVSHELKTPISSIKGYLQILKSKVGNHETVYYLGKMVSQIERLSGLVDNLLDTSRIDSGKLNLQVEKFELPLLISRIVEDFRNLSKHSFIVQANSKSQQVLADKYRIEEVLINLISNAVKFSPKGREIVIKSETNHKWAVVSVRDFGVGISQKYLDKIFQPFFQAGTRIRQSFSGLGLGLYISSQIIKLHKGSMWVKSKKGEGSIFFFSLPLKI